MSLGTLVLPVCFQLKMIREMRVALVFCVTSLVVLPCTPGWITWRRGLDGIIGGRRGAKVGAGTILYAFPADIRIIALNRSAFASALMIASKATLKEHYNEIIFSVQSLQKLPTSPYRPQYHLQATLFLINGELAHAPDW